MKLKQLNVVHSIFFNYAFFKKIILAESQKMEKWRRLDEFSFHI